MADLEPVSSLWIGEALSPLEVACFSSFLAKGHRVRLYAYNEIANVPAAVERMQADEILPRSEMFTYRDGPGAGSPAAFANVFRYKLLANRGGWWVDADVFCLRPFVFADDVVLGFQEPGLLNNAVMKAPAHHPLVEEVYLRARALGDRVEWGDGGPALVTAVAAKLGLLERALPPEAFYPVPYRDWRQSFLASEREWVRSVTESSFALHFWHELIRRDGLPKQGSYERGCCFAELAMSVGVPLHLRDPKIVGVGDS